ncbi:MAG: hypothetical protein PHE84_02920 [bacterium]|nr:hypothetical protein [bacterium]
MKSKTCLEKWLEYLPLIPILGFLLSFIGAARRLDHIYFFVLGLVTLPVWIFLIMAALKIKRMKKTSGEGDPELNTSSYDKGT